MCLGLNSFNKILCEMSFGYWFVYVSRTLVDLVLHINFLHHSSFKKNNIFWCPAYLVVVNIILTSNWEICLSPPNGNGDCLRALLILPSHQNRFKWTLVAQHNIYRGQFEQTKFFIFTTLKEKGSTQILKEYFNECFN